MSVLLIPLNNNKLPAKNFMTDELAEQISKSDIFLKKKEIIESHPLFMVFLKLSLTEQKKTFEGYMSKELSARLDAEIKQNHPRRQWSTTNRLSSPRRQRSTTNILSSPRRQRSTTNRLSSPRRQRSTTNRRYSPIKEKNITKSNIEYPRFNSLSYTGTLVPSLAGGAFGTILGIIMFIIFIILLLSPITFNSFMATSDAQLIALQNQIQIMTNVSIDKNESRLVYFVITESDNYFLKISPSDVIKNKQESRQFDIQELNTFNVGEYVYECLIYEEMNRPTGVQYQGRDLNYYVSEIVDWNIKEIIESTNNFVVDLEEGQIDLNTFPSTYEGFNMELCNSVLINNWKYPTPDKYYCYSLVKAYDGFTTFSDYLNDRSFGNLMQIFSNVCNILRLFFRIKQFCHWDLHSNNLLVNGITGEIKLFDFDLSEIYNSVSDIRDGRCEFLADPRVIIKDQLGHLFDYYRLIIENIHYNNDIRMFFLNLIGSFDEREIIRYFNSNGILHTSQNNVYTQTEILKYREMAMTIRKKNYKKNYKKFYNTIFFFNNIE